MSKKFFSLIYGDSVRIAPKQKIVPAADFSKLINAEEVLQKTRDEVEQYRLEVIKECERLKEKAQKDGFQEGFKQWVEHIAKLEQEIEKVHKELEKAIVPIALKAAKKILGRELEQSPAIVDIVANVLKSVSQHKKITIYANRGDLEALESNKNRLKQIFESLESLSIRPRDDIAPGGCIIETEAGIINAQLDNQWRILEQAFDTIMRKNK